MMQRSYWITGFILVLNLLGCANSSYEGKLPGPPKPPPDYPDAVSMPIDPALTAAAKQEIDNAAESNNAFIRAHAIEAIQKTRGGEGADRILQGLDDDKSVVRFASALAAGQLGLQQAKPKLLGMVNDPSASVQVAVRFALHKLGDTRRSHDLEKTARYGPDDVRSNTVLVLGLLGEPSAIKILRSLRSDQDPALRLQVAEAMWRLGSEQGLDELIGATLSRYPDDQIISLLALGEKRDRRVIEHVRGALVSDYPEVALAAARAMGMLGSDQGYGVAMRGAKSRDPRQRLLAAMAFGDIGRSDAQQYLGPLLQDSDPDVRLAAAVAILQLEMSEHGAVSDKL